MEVPVGGDIGEEVHTVDQILIFTSGKGRAEVSGKKQEIKANDVVIVPAGCLHQVCCVIFLTFFWTRFNGCVNRCCVWLIHANFLLVLVQPF